MTDKAARAAVESLAAALSPVIAPDAVALGLAPAMSPPSVLPVPPVRDDAGGRPCPFGLMGLIVSKIRVNWSSCLRG